ncbi:hypothetical protein NB640_12045 [Oxalobacter vibrioformis]|uniref:Uncharacterized protein n=1 Tax=Oxalobacter vibrioformis TaxID=933080 RepID=A0A9E9LUL9_9BURK|nr:hypothetical protein [Oxalobacter vibrioformis]NLC23738.1 hypothetical protein [Oxalobacter sp.]WAW09935.1 hypothetical protein NB640_12045 [Oxalobacter vibrioformis]
MANELTDDIRRIINQDWRVGVEKEEGILVYDVRSRIGNAMRADEAWFVYRKSTGKRGNWAVAEPKIFTEVRMEDVCYCYNQSLGSHYLAKGLEGEYDV